MEERNVKVHELKTWPEYFQAIERGEKTFEVRVNDRDYQLGDTLILKEYDPEIESYTGRELTVTVGYMGRGPFFQSAGSLSEYAIMSIVIPTNKGE